MTHIDKLLWWISPKMGGAEAVALRDWLLAAVLGAVDSDSRRTDLLRGAALTALRESGEGADKMADDVLHPRWDGIAGGGVVKALKTAAQSPKGWGRPLWLGRFVDLFSALFEADDQWLIAALGAHYRPTLEESVVACCDSDGYGCDSCAGSGVVWRDAIS